MFLNKKDSVSVSRDGVVYYRVQNLILAVVNIKNADAATQMLAQTHGLGLGGQPRG